MADEPEKNDLEAAELDDDSVGGLDLGPDEMDDQGRRPHAEKVELDTAGLELDDLEEEEPELEIEPEEEEEEEEDLEEEKAGRPRWFWPVVAGGLCLILALLILVVGRYIFLKEEAEVEVLEPETEVAAPVDKPAALPEAPPQGAALVGLGHFLVPLDRPDQTVLRVSISLQLASEPSRASVLRKTTLVRDIVFRVLEVRGQGELKSKEARQLMAQQIKQEINLKLEGGPVLNVYFTEFLVL